MNILNIPFQFGIKEKVINLDNINYKKFIFFLGKLDYLCEKDYLLEKQINSASSYVLVDILDYKLNDIELEDINYNLDIIITDKNNLKNKKKIVVIENDNNYNVYFNYNESDLELLITLLKSFDNFKDSFNYTKEYKFIENELLFIEKYNKQENLNFRNKTLLEYFEESVLENRNNIAISFKNKNLTYSNFYKLVKVLSSEIIKLSNINDSISILLDKSEYFIISIWAILYSGCNYVPIDIDDPNDRKNFIIKNSNSKLVITDQNNFKSNIHTLNINDINFDKENNNLKFRENNEGLAYILHTSGTTGEPKGVKIPINGLLNYSLYQKNILKWCNKDIIIQKTPYIWDVSLREIVVPFISGSRVIISETEKHKDPEYILNLIIKEKVTFVHFVPSMLSIFLEFVINNEDLNSIKNVVCSGEALPDQLRIRFYKNFKNAVLYNMYGPTEATVEVTNYTCPKDDIDMKMHIGRTIPNTPLLIINRDNILLPQGIIGELHIGGPQVSTGYVNQKELTDKTFIDNKYVKGKIYKTGDLSRLLTDNNIDYLGRIDSQIKVRGMRIEISEIKKNILKYVGVSDCHINIYKKNNKDFLIAYVTPETINEEELILSISQFLPKQMIPDKIIKLKELPISKNGKLDKTLLPEPSFENSNESSIMIIKKDLKRIINDYFNKNNYTNSEELINLINNSVNNIDKDFLEIFSDLLNIPTNQINVNLKLDYLGIDSIKMMKLQSLMRNKNYKITINDLEKYKTIKDIYNNLTKETINTKYDVNYYFNEINKIISNNDKYILIHSSLPNLNLDVDDIIKLFNNLFMNWIKQGITILIPSFTTESFPKDKIFDKAKNLTETGILADILYKMEGSVRTKCPFYSFVTIGQNKDKFNINSETSLGNNSVFDLGEKYNIKLVGIGTQSFTQFHRYEEINKVPYRYYKKFTGKYQNNEIITEISQYHYVRDLDVKVKNLPDCKILDLLGNKMVTSKLGNTFIKTIYTNQMKSVFDIALKDPFLFISNKKQLIEYYQEKDYNFNLINVKNSPIMIHFLKERDIDNINTNFYQFSVLDILKSFKTDNIIKNIEEVLFEFSSLFYKLKDDKFVLDLNLRKFIKDKIIQSENNDIDYLIKTYSNKLDLSIGNNFYVIYTDNKLIILINHFLVDGISWRLLYDNLNNQFNNKNDFEERNRFDIWTDNLNDILVSESEIKYWNKIHNSINKLFNSEYNNYSNVNCKIFEKEIKISENKFNLNIRNFVLSKLSKALIKSLDVNKLSINIETHGREEINYLTNINEIFGWFTSYFPMIILKEEDDISDIENKFKNLNKNGINYLLLKYGFIKDKKLVEEKNKIDILFNFMGDLNFKSENFKLNKIDERGDCGHALNFWFDVKTNNNNGCILNIKLYYLENIVSDKLINKIILNLEENLLC